MAAFGWRLVHGGKTPPPGGVVKPGERLSWPRTVGLGAQHVVAMFGATFVFPIVMGLNPQLAIMMSGIATICFLLIVSGRVPSYLGTSASFVSGVVAIRAQGGDSASVTGAILVAGAVLAVAGILIHVLGYRILHAVLPPVVTGAVVMLIGFNLAPVVATIYWPADQWVALATMAFVMLVAVGFRGFIGRIAVFIGLIFGYLLSWLLDHTVGQITSVPAGASQATTHYRVDWTGVGRADWFGFPAKTTTGTTARRSSGGTCPTSASHSSCSCCRR
jgi:xanthine/uracil permease